MNWEFKHNNSLLIGINKEIPKFNKVAAFDMVKHNFGINVEFLFIILGWHFNYS
jgi:hypothetical protein